MGWIPEGVAAVTFDVGGTLIECSPSVGHIYAEVAAEHGYPGISPGLLNSRFAEAWRAFPDFRHTRSQWQSLVDATFGALTPDPPSRTFFPALYDRFARRDAWHVFADVIPALHLLKIRGLRLGVISNWDDRLRPLLRELDLERFFETITVSCEVGDPKPSPSIFIAAAGVLGCSPGAVLHVGDSRVMDVQGAQEAGMHGLLLDRRAKGQTAGVIQSLEQLIRA